MSCFLLHSFIHLLHIPLILYRCGNSHIIYLNLSVFGLSYSTKHLEHNEALQEVYRSTIFSLKHMWLYKLSPICLASLCTEMCVIIYQDDATDQQIAHWLLTLKAQVSFHGSPWGICGSGTEDFSDYFSCSVCWHCINAPPEFVSHQADGKGAH